MIPLSAFLHIELVAAALLAFWVVLRFPQRGPMSVPGASAAIVVALGIARLAPIAGELVVRLPIGPYLVLLGVGLPIFFGIFLSGGWFVRALVRRIGGSGGGGLRVPALPSPR